jgi:hypothetical protein
MPRTKKTFLSLAVFAALALSSALTAKADILIVSGNTASGAQIVTLTPATVNTITPSTALPITGTIGIGGTIVNFRDPSGSSGALTANASTITRGTSNLTGAYLGDLNINLANNAAFTSAVVTFSSNVLGTTGGGTVQFRITGTGLTTGTGQSFDPNGRLVANVTVPNGTTSNTFTVTALNNQTITNLEFYTLGSSVFTSYGPFQIGLPTTPGGGGGGTGTTPGAVPEPTTMLLLGTGLAGFAAKVGRRRRSKASSTEAV